MAVDDAVENSRKKKTTNKSKPAQPGEAVAAIKHRAKRKNIPSVGLEAQGRITEVPPVRYEYNPHLPPALRSSDRPAETDTELEMLQRAFARARWRHDNLRLLDEARTRPLTTEEVDRLIEDVKQSAPSEETVQALLQAVRRHEPWLEWSGKREKPWFEVDPVALHIHERVSTQAILRVLAREDVQRDLFADPQQSYAEAVQFYQHDVDWSNRMILGDSLQVMASLARREDLAGKVQMIYIDPPYGIKFSSNFQPQLGQRDVKDREQDLTREPEMVKAYRDTWTLGIHSYLAYLRDRLLMARLLLANTGSIFVQIGDENIHLVRSLLDEAFGVVNFIGLITIRKTTGSTADFIPGSSDYLLWYGKAKSSTKFRTIFEEKTPGAEGATGYSKIELPSGETRTLAPDLPAGGDVFAGDNITSQSVGRSKGEGAASWFKVNVGGVEFTPGPKARWKTNEEGMRRLQLAERLLGGDRSTLSYKRKLTDFPVTAIGNIWTDTVGQNQLGGEKIYVVQTPLKVIERCMLMTTDPGDLALDPTCGSGTTAFVAEQWGRRWITIDTSRVALALARQRLMTARFPYYDLRPLSAEDVQRNPHGTWLADPTGRVPGKATFKYKTVSHITLKSIARNPSLDPIFDKHEPILAARLTELNRALKGVTPELRQKLASKLTEKQKREGKKAISDADRRRWSLPASGAGWNDWEVPFDADPEWPKTLQEALTAYRAAWRAKMDEVNDTIAANAEMEELVNDPHEIKGVVRVSGPFSMEGVIAVEQRPDSPIGGEPTDELETFDESDIEVINAEAHLDKIIRLLKESGVDFAANRNRKFSRLEATGGPLLLHAEGEWANGDGVPRRVAVSIGPEVGNVSAYQVEEAVRAANRRGYDDLVVAGFGFDAAAQAIIEESSHPNLRAHMALIRPDVAMDDLLKTKPGSQIFTVFSAPRVRWPEKQDDGQYMLEVEGMDVYDPVSNTLYPTDKERIAAWFLDSDYDGRTFCISQAFFPDKTKWKKLAKALGDQGVVDENAFDALSGLRSLPFPRPTRLKSSEKWRIAVKVIDPRGNEGLRVIEMA